jgi:hypothetical protein
MATDFPPPDKPPAPVSAGAAPQSPGATNYYLEAYKLLADMVRNEELAFGARNQLFLTLNSGLVVILFGVLTLLGKEAAPAPPAPAGTPQVVPAPSGAPAGAITIQQIVNQPAGSPAGSRPRILAVPLLAACGMGAFLCLLWTCLIKRSQGMNDYYVAHMKDLEEDRLSEIAIMRKYDALFERRTGRRWDGTTQIPFKSETVKLPWWGSLLRLYNVWCWIAAGFILLWVVFGVASLFYLL